MSGSRRVRVEILGDPKKAQQAFAAAGQSADSFGDKLAGLGKGVAVAGAAIGAALVTAGIAGTKMAADTAAAQGKLQAQLGLTADEAEELGDVAKRVFAGNFGDSVSGVMSDIALLRQNIGEMSAETTQQVAESAYTLRDVFGAEIEETSRTVGVLTKNFEGLSATDAFDIMTVGFQQGANYSDEMLDTLREYSPMFASLGMSADQMMATLIEGAQAGAWNLDKVGDAVKEFNIRAQDGSTLTAQAFSDIGLSADHMSAAIAAGGEQAQSAFVATLTALAAIEDPLARNAAGVALFGTQWEDLEDDVVLAMANGQKGLEGFEGATKRAGDAAYNNLGSALETLKRTAMVLLSDAMMPLVGVLTTLAQWATTQMPRVQAVMETAFGVVGDILRDDVLPVGERFLGFLQDVKAAFDQGGLSAALKEAGSGLASFGAEIGSAIWDGVSGVDWPGVARDLWDRLSGALGEVVDFGADLGGWITDTVGNADWAAIGTTVWDAILGGIKQGTEWGTDFAQWFADTVSAVDWSSYATTIWDTVKAAWFTLTEWGGDFASWFVGVVTGVDWAESATSIWDTIKSAWFSLTEWGGEFASWVSGVATGTDWTGTATAMWGAIKAAWFAIVDWGGELVAWVTTAVTSTDWTGAATSIRDKIVSAAQSLDWSAVGQTISDAIKPPEDGGGWKTIFADIRQEVEPLTSAVSGALTAAFNAIGPTIRGVGEALSGLDLEGLQRGMTAAATAVGTIFAVAVVGAAKALEILAPLLSTVIPVAVQIVVTILNVLIGTFETVATTIQNVVNTVMALLQGDSAGAWESAKLVVTGFVGGVIGTLTGFASEAWGIVDGLVGDVLGGLGRWAAEAPGIVSGFVGSVQGFLSDMASEGVRLVTGLVTDVLGKLAELATEVVSKGAAVVSGFAQGILDTISTALSAVGTLKSDLIGVFSDALSWLTGAGGDVLTGLYNGMVDIKGWVIDQATGLAGSIKDGIVDGFKGVFGISSPSRVIADEVGRPVAQGVSMGMADAVPEVLAQAGSVARQVADGVVGSFGSAVREREPDLAAAGQRAPRAVADGVEQGAQAVGDRAYRAARGITEQIMAGLEPDATKDDINAAWMDVIGGMDDILSGDAASRLNATLRDLQAQVEWARLIGAPPDVIQQRQEQIAQTEAELATVGEAYALAVKNGYVDAWTPEMVAGMADKMDAILDGSLAKQMQADLDDMNERIAKATALGWNKELIDEWQKQADELAADLEGVNSDMSAAAAQGLLSPEAQAAYDKAMGIVTKIPVEKWREAIAVMGDDWITMMDDLAADVASGAMTIDEAMSVLPEMTAEQADAVEEELRRLEAQFREELAQAVLTGTEEAKEAARANLQAIIDMLAATGAAAQQTGDDVNSALTSLFAPSSSGDGSGGGGGGSPITRPSGGRGSDAYEGMAQGGGGINLNPQWGQQAPQVNVYIGNEQVAAHVETEMLSAVDGALLGEAG